MYNSFYYFLTSLHIVYFQHFKSTSLKSTDKTYMTHMSLLFSAIGCLYVTLFCKTMTF